MISFEAMAANLVIRWSVKRRSRGPIHVQRARRSLEKRVRSTPMPAWPLERVSLQADPQRGLCPAEWLIPEQVDRTVVYFHGGGYFFCSLNTHRPVCAYLARAARAQVLSVDYRLAPEHVFPAAVDDAVAWWRALLASGTDPSQVVFAGDSAGGGLALSCLLASRDLGLALPAGAVLFSPLLDLTCSGPTMVTMRRADVMFNPESIPQAAALYLAGQDAAQPLASPLFGDLAGLPPLLIQASQHEILLSDSTRLHDRVQAVGGRSELQLNRRMPHAWQTLVFLPEARASLKRAGQFMAEVTASATATQATGVTTAPSTPIGRGA